MAKVKAWPKEVFVLREREAAREIVNEFGIPSVAIGSARVLAERIARALDAFAAARVAEERGLIVQTIEGRARAAYAAAAAAEESGFHADAGEHLQRAWMFDDLAAALRSLEGAQP